MLNPEIEMLHVGITITDKGCANQDTGFVEAQLSSSLQVDVGLLVCAATIWMGAILRRARSTGEHQILIAVSSKVDKYGLHARRADSFYPGANLIVKFFCGECTFDR